MQFREVIHSKIRRGNYVLVADIGGTHTNFAVLTKRKLLLSLHYPSKKITNFTQIVLEVLNHLKQKHKITPRKACYAVAGPIALNGLKGEVTKLPWSLDKKNLEQKTKLSTLLINDFQAAALGIDALPKQDLFLIKPGQKLQHKARAVLGAGTGLGKSIAYWDQHKKAYGTLPSEGGHGDISVQSIKEMELVQFIKKQKRGNISWDDMVSGAGIGDIYKFLEKQKRRKVTKYMTQVKDSNYDASVIAKFKNLDPLCKETFSHFIKFYARAAKNLALDSLALGGIFLAGGIVATHHTGFKNQIFIKEFTNSRMAHILKKIPVYAIKNYGVSLYGCAVALEYQKLV
jgi:glucokinase